MVVARTIVSALLCLAIGVLQEPSYISLVVACPYEDGEDGPWIYARACLVVVPQRRYTTRPHAKVRVHFHSTNHLYVIIESWLVLRQTSCKRVISHSGVPLQSYSQRTHSLLYSLSCHGLCLSLQSIYYVLLCSGNTLQRLLYPAMPLLAFWSSRGCKEQNIPLFFSWLCSI